jgi:uncharacterized protein (TIGR02611 family)
VRQNRVAHLMWRVLVGVVGTAIVVTGIVLLPLPGPGWLIIFVGLGVLASEFAWARRLLDFARAKVEAWTGWVTRQSLLVRLLIGTATLAIVALALLGYLAWQGLPTWLPASMRSWLSSWLPLV